MPKLKPSKRAMVNDGAYQSPNMAPYNLAEIWPFPINIGVSGTRFDLRRVWLGQVLGQFTEKANLNREVIDDGDLMVLDHRATQSFDSRKHRDLAPQEESSTGYGTNDCEGKRVKTVGSSEENVNSKAEAKENSNKSVEQNAKPIVEPPKQDHIHVRARKGQATNSHRI